MESTINELGKIDSISTQKLIDSGEVIQNENTYLVIEDISIVNDIKRRKLLNNEYVDELNEPLTLNVITKCPSKWVLQDLETGQVYRGTDNTNVGKHWIEFFHKPPSTSNKKNK
jgi:hypothetical protein